MRSQRKGDRERSGARDRIGSKQSRVGREVPGKAQPLGRSLGCVFMQSRGYTDGLK